jgi:hypothetical protein
MVEMNQDGRREIKFLNSQRYLGLGVRQENYPQRSLFTVKVGTREGKEIVGVANTTSKIADKSRERV